MAVRLRLKRIGSKGKPFYRIIAIDRREKRDGREIEIVGQYSPFDETRTVLKKDRIEHWLKHGAIPTPTVKTLITKAS